MFLEAEEIDNFVRDTVSELEFAIRFEYSI
jgi:hypothetical protein